MSPIITVFAVFGFFAVMRHGARAFLRLLGRGVETFVAAQETSVRERRGDVTGLQEAVQRHRIARRARLGAVAGVAFWSALLIVPLFTPWTAALYAAFAVLWLLPIHRTA
ncbi:MAG: hypothetical protein L0271_22585 [Gemmatimonadetes bacterium]|nr:hypothetical protein [Gemmatimonadota bacterium]